MPKQPNITLYSCDRPSCVNKEYVLPNATASPNWHEVTRVDRNGNQRKILLAFRCLVWVSGSGGGGAGRVVWGYGYHVVVHRRPATA